MTFDVVHGSGLPNPGKGMGTQERDPGGFDLDHLISEQVLTYRRQ